MCWEQRAQGELEAASAGECLAEGPHQLVVVQLIASRGAAEAERYTQYEKLEQPEPHLIQEAVAQGSEPLRKAGLAAGATPAPSGALHDELGNPLEGALFLGGPPERSPRTP